MVPPGRARLPPSRQPLGGRGSRRAVNPREGEAPAEPTNPREGEAPAEPATLGRARLPPSRQTSGGRGSRRADTPSGGRGSCRAVNPREGEAPAEPQTLGRARLPPSRHTLGSASLLPSRRIQPLDELCGSSGVSPSLDRSQHPWQFNLQLRAGFCVDPQKTRHSETSRCRIRGDFCADFLQHTPKVHTNSEIVTDSSP